MTEPVTVGYWSIRALVEPIRLMLEIAGIPYNLVEYNAKQREDGTADRSEWESVKYTDELGLDFPNLPYYMEPSGFKISQSNAIMRRIAKKQGLRRLNANFFD